MRTKRIRTVLTVFLCACLLSGCAAPSAQQTKDPLSEEKSSENEVVFKETDTGKEAVPAVTDGEKQNNTYDQTEAEAPLSDSPEAEEPMSEPPEAEEPVNESPKTEEPLRNTSDAEEAELPSDEELQIRNILQGMSLEAKIAQMFVLLPEQLTGMDEVTEAGELTRAALAGFPVGGLLYLEGSLQSYEQTKTLLSNTQQISLEVTGFPMLTFVDEEGGSVSRVSGRFPEAPWIESMAVYGQNGSEEEVCEIGRSMGAYLSDLGFTCDCAPVADVLTNPENYVIGERSFGSDPYLVAKMAAALGNGLESEGVTAVYKHFPGHGGTAGDTHEGYSSLERTKEELYACDLIPFISAIENGAKIIMAAHITLPNVTQDGLPASLSPQILTGLLRQELGYDGLIITDALNMGAVANQYTSAEAAVMAVQAGADLLLMPMDPFLAYQGVLDAVHSGEILPERIDESVTRILKLKLYRE